MDPRKVVLLFNKTSFKNGSYLYHPCSILHLILLFYIDYTMTFASLIARCAKDIDYLIESLPSEDSSTELQVNSLCTPYIISMCSEMT